MDNFELIIPTTLGRAICEIESPCKDCKNIYGECGYEPKLSRSKLKDKTYHIHSTCKGFKLNEEAGERIARKLEEALG